MGSCSRFRIHTLLCGISLSEINDGSSLIQLFIQYYFNEIKRSNHSLHFLHPVLYIPPRLRICIGFPDSQGLEIGHILQFFGTLWYQV